MKMPRNETFFTYTVLLVCFMVVISLFSISGIATPNQPETSITKTYSFQKPEISQVKINDVLYDRVEYSNAPSVGAVGTPKLPAYGVNLLLPHGCSLEDVTVKTGDYVSLGAGFSIEPVQTPVKLSEYVTEDSYFMEYQNDQNANSPGLFSIVGTYWFRGYPILVLLLHPVVYNVDSGELGYFMDITVDVTVTSEDALPSSMFRRSKIDEQAVRLKVDNPDMVSLYSQGVGMTGVDGYDLLILTTSEFENAFEPLQQAHNTRGMATEIKTLRDISPIPGRVTTEDIREFIRDEYLTYGIEYVLIGGDDNVIMAKDLWVRSWSGGETTLMPSDLYYACLDGTYNYDEDELWGEPSDGDNGEDVDLLAEVYVGRASVGSISEVHTFVTKTLAHLNGDGFSTNDVLMVGEHLWSNPDTWGGDYMDELINQSSQNMYQTVGIPTNLYAIAKVYDRDWQGNDWPKSELISRLNQGVSIINHLGHSGKEYNMKLVNIEVANLRNSDPFFIYSQGCTAGAFDYEDCIAEYHTVKTDSAAFAVIMNARYGWGVVGSTDGPNQRYHREFWDAVFGEDIPEIGKANQDSKEDSLSHIGGSCMRWCYYELNLFGDPTLQIRTTDNAPPNAPARPTIVKQGKIGEESIYATSAIDVDVDELYYKWDWDDGTTSEWLGPFTSGEEIQVSHTWSKAGAYQVKVIARDEHLASSDWSDPLPIRLTIINEFPLLNLLLQLLQRFFPNILM